MAGDALAHRKGVNSTVRGNEGVVHLLRVHVRMVMTHMDAASFGARHGALKHHTGLLNAMLSGKHGLEIGVRHQRPIVKMEGFCRHLEGFNGLQRSSQFVAGRAAVEHVSDQGTDG